MLTDWTDENPARVFAKLKKQSDYYNFHQRTVGDFFRDVRTQGFRQRSPTATRGDEMRMNPTDLADVVGSHLHLSDERHGAGGKLDGAVQARRARAPAVHQRLGDVVLRRPDPG